MNSSIHILCHLLDVGAPQSQSAIAKATGCPPSVVSLRLREMRKVGLIDQHRTDWDGRGPRAYWTIGERVRLGVLRDQPKADE